MAARRTAAKTDGGKTDGNKTDGGKTDGGKTDGNKTDGGKTDGSKTDGGMLFIHFRDPQGHPRGQRGPCGCAGRIPCTTIEFLVLARV